MSSPVDNARTGRHTIEDWLELHALDRDFCFQVLDALGRDDQGFADGRLDAVSPYEALDTQAMWALAIRALGDFLPQHHEFLEDVFQRSERIEISASQASRRALTIDQGPSKYPTIMYRLNGDASDPLIIAHEFGHALQIRASEGRFVAPVLREVCAFLAEGALLACCRKHDPRRHAALLKRWQADNRKYFGKLARKLEAALSEDGAIYDYGWNYPVARFLAVRISASFPEADMWRILRGECSIRELLRSLDS
jgi:hypothetical protein